jgi:hypothetical protein
LFEQLQNELAVQVRTNPIFSGIKMASGEPWFVLTEDEGDIEYLYTQMINLAGLSVIVQSPTGRVKTQFRNLPGPRFSPLEFVVSVSEAVVFNRSETGTNVRLMKAVRAAFESLHLWKPPSVSIVLQSTEIRKDLTTHPDTGALVASRLLFFEADGVNFGGTVIPTAPTAGVIWQFHEEIVSLTGPEPSLAGLSTVTWAVGSLVEIILIINESRQRQAWNLLPNAADPDDPGQVAPFDFNSSTNNKHWERVG